MKRKNPINEPLFAARPAGLEDLNPYAADHRRGGAAPRHPRRGDRPAWGEMRLTHRRPHGAHPRVAVGADQRRGDEPLRRQAGDPADPGAGGGPGRPRRTWSSTGDLAAAEERSWPRSARSWSSPRGGEQGRGITVGVRDEDGLRAGGRARAPPLPRRAARGAGGRRRRARPRHRPAGRRGRGAPAGRRRRQRPRTPSASWSASTSRRRRAGHRRGVAHPAGRDHRAGRARRRLRHGRRARPRASGSTSGGRPTCTPAAPSRTSPTELHPALADAAVRAAAELGIPVTGIDFLVPDVARPRLRLRRGQRAAGAGQPRAAAGRERFVDLLFPETRRR